MWDQLFDASGMPPSRAEGRASFIPELDEAVAGLAPGEVWVLTGHAGSGKSILATQLALHWLFEHKLPVTLYSLRDPLFAVWTRMVAHTARVPMSAARAGSFDEDASARVEAATRRLAASPLRVSTQWHALTGASPTPEMHPKGAGLLVIDDAHLLADADLVAQLSRWASTTGTSVLLTAPATHVYSENPDAPYGVAITDRFAGHVEQVAQIRWITHPPAPDDYRLQLLYHRWGPVRDIEVYFEPFYGRFRPVHF